MITVLCGGAGSLRLIRGLRTVLHDPEIAVVATTADALVMSGGHLLPTLDAALFLFSGILDTRRGGGIAADSRTTHRFLAAIGRPERVAVGDKERAVQIARAGMLAAELSLTAACEVIAGGLGLTATVLPVTDDEATVVVGTGEGPVPLAVFREMEQGACEAAGAALISSGVPGATKKVRETIEQSDAVIIGPDPPLSGIVPLLSCTGIAESLSGRFTIAISPFCGGSRLPAFEEELFAAEGLVADSAEVFALYGDYCDLFVQDRRDPCAVEGALALDTRLSSRAQCESLAWDLMAIVRRRSTVGRGSP